MLKVFFVKDNFFWKRRRQFRIREQHLINTSS